MPATVYRAHCFIVINYFKRDICYYVIRIYACFCQRSAANPMVFMPRVTYTMRARACAKPVWFRRKIKINNNALCPRPRRGGGGGGHRVLSAGVTDPVVLAAPYAAPRSSPVYTVVKYAFSSR